MAEKKQKTNYVLVTGIIIAIVLAIIIVPIILFAFIGALLGGTSAPTISGNVLIIPIHGVIVAETQPSIFGSSGAVSSTNIIRILDEAENNRKVDAVILEINSPGGSGVASDEIARRVATFNKPIVANIRESGASGAYWVASSTDYITANRFSIVGSIGVIASYLEFSGLLEHFNISYQRFVAGDNKDFGSPFREPTPQEAQQFQALLDEMHTIFIQEVAKGRNMPEQDIRALADGSIYTGSQAVSLGLIDSTGGMDDAIAYLEDVLNKQVSVSRYSRNPSFLELLATVGTQPFGFFLSDTQVPIIKT
ncbi:MAG: signal peptide peptidase SppA [Candidatus Woesearchaeota archaeon]